MLNLAKGYKIYEPERLNEEYEVTDDVTLMANVDVEKIKEVFQHFIVMHDEPFLKILDSVNPKSMRLLPKIYTLLKLLPQCGNNLIVQTVCTN